jgi:quercetin dioxygenase-like cupin family protein
MSVTTAYQLAKWTEIPAEHPAPGIERRMMVGERVMICRLHFAPNVVTPVHTHPHEQMTVVEQGRVKFYIGPDQKETIVGPGDVLHFASNVSHGATMMDDEVVLFDIFSPVREDFLGK